MVYILPGTANESRMKTWQDTAKVLRYPLEYSRVQETRPYLVVEICCCLSIVGVYHRHHEHVPYRYQYHSFWMFSTSTAAERVVVVAGLKLFPSLVMITSSVLCTKGAPPATTNLVGATMKIVDTGIINSKYNGNQQYASSATGRAQLSFCFLFRCSNRL